MVISQRGAQPLDPIVLFGG